VRAFDGSTGVKIGVFADSTDRSMPILELAKAMEERGFTGLFLNEHPHLPVDHSRSQFPAGDSIPDRYARLWCPYTALAMVAAQTSMEVGPSVSLIAEHDPIALAKTVATLDVLSNGRFLLGVGWGWHREEFEAQGFPANVRARVLEEKLAVMKALWTQDVASFDGEYVRLEASMSWPKPVSKPHPPVFGGLPANERNFKRLARWADGWIPMGSPLSSTAKAAWSDAPPIEQCIAAIREELEAVGRDPATFRLISIQNHLSPDELKVAVDRAVELGVERINVKMSERPTDETVRTLDAVAETLHGLLG
jgi:probable F420-dependent oxidoreductase